MGPAKQWMVGGSGLDTFPDDILASSLLDANRILDLALTQRKRVAASRESRWGREVSTPAAGFLGPVVLFAVGFIAQNAIDLVDDGR